MFPSPMDFLKSHAIAFLAGAVASLLSKWFQRAHQDKRAGESLPSPVQRAVPQTVITFEPCRWGFLPGGCQHRSSLIPADVLRGQRRNCLGRPAQKKDRVTGNFRPVPSHSCCGFRGKIWQGAGLCRCWERCKEALAPLLCYNDSVAST